MTASTLIARKPSMSGLYGTARTAGVAKAALASGRSAALGGYSINVTIEKPPEPHRQQRERCPNDVPP